MTGQLIFFQPHPQTSLPGQLHVDPAHPLADRLLIVVLTTNAPPIASIRWAAARPDLVDDLEHPGDFAKAVVEVLAMPGPFFSAGGSTAIRGAQRAIYAHDMLDSWEYPGDQKNHRHLPGKLPFDRLVVQLESLVATGSRKQALLLSGDVHHSFASRLTLFAPGHHDGIVDTPRMVVGQLVASPFKNQTKTTRGLQLEGYTYADPEFARMVVPDHKPEAVEGPVLAGGDSSLYRLDYLVAERSKAPPGAIPDSLQVVPGQDVANLSNYHKMSNTSGGACLASVVSSAAASPFVEYEGASALEIIGHNNVAELTFGASSVRHRVHWLGPNKKVYVTTYNVSLDLSDRRMR